jgi:hypothetical protein
MLVNGKTISLDSGQEQVQINTANALDSNNQPYTITATHADGTASTVSTHSDPEGFGVAGSASGDSSEIGHQNGVGSERLSIALGHEVSSVDVSFAWEHGAHTDNPAETAQYTFYKNGVEVGTGSNTGGSDGVDSAITLKPSDGATFDTIVFSAPHSGDDYLIHSLTYAQASQTSVYEYPVDISAALTDRDGSESLTVIVSGVPTGATLNEGTRNTDGTWSLTVPAGHLDYTSSSLSMTVPDGTANFALKVTARATEANDNTNGTNYAESSANVSVALPDPQTTDDAISTKEDTALTLSVSDFGQYTDTGNNALAAVKVISLPTDGQLMLNGSAITAGTEILKSDIDSGHLKFLPALNTDNNSSFKFAVSDGIAWSAEHVNTVTVTAVADAPTISMEIGSLTKTETTDSSENGDTERDDSKSSDGEHGDSKSGYSESNDNEHGDCESSDSDHKAAANTSNLSISATLTDTDGSESLSNIKLTQLPSDGSSSITGTGVSTNSDGSYEVALQSNGQIASDVKISSSRVLTSDELNAIHASVTSTETHGGDTATTTTNDSGIDFMYGSSDDDAFMIENHQSSKETEGDQTHIDHFDPSNDVLNLSDVINSGVNMDHDSLSQYLNFSSVDSNGDGKTDDTKVTIDSNGAAEGGTKTEVYLHDVPDTDTVIIQIDDNKVDYTDH